MIFPKDAPIRRQPIDTVLSILAMLFIMGLIIVGGLGTIFGIRNMIGGSWR